MSFLHSPLASSEWAGLVWAMRSAPQDDTARLIAADWLQDTGLPELVAWAEFVRYQVEAFRVPKRGHVYSDSCDCWGCRPERRATMLYDQWGTFWGAHTFATLAVTDGLKPGAGAVGHYERGFLRYTMAAFHDFRVSIVPKAAALFLDRQPVRQCVIQLWPATRQILRRTDIAEWVLTLVIEDTSDGSARAVRSILTRPPDVTRNVKSYRRADTPQQLPRMIRAVVSDVLRSRRELTPGEPVLDARGRRIPPGIETGSLRRSRDSNDGRESRGRVFM